MIYSLYNCIRELGGFKLAFNLNYKSAVQVLTLSRIWADSSKTEVKPC